MGVNTFDRKIFPVFVTIFVFASPAAVFASDFSPQCPGDYMIGALVVPSMEYRCPEGSGAWAASNLFDDPTLPPELLAYCLYEWTNPTVEPIHSLLPNSPDGRHKSVWLQPDCNVVAPLSHPFEQNDADTLEAAYLAQIEARTTLPRIGFPSATKVMVVDSSIDSNFPLAGPGVIEHGELVGTIIRKLSCPSPLATSACLSRVSSRLALPLRSEDGVIYFDDDHGGEFGALRHLARAIVDAYNYAAGEPGSNRIIINLSLGWDSRWGGSYPGTNWMSLDPPVRAVQSAISYTACHNALVIAAAGNRSGSPDELNTASFPGRWENKPTPAATRCNNYLGGDTRVAAMMTGYTPLLHAASGVTGADELLLNVKEGSIPRLVAPAAHVGFVSDQSDHAITGSSVGAASVAGIAAAVWAYQPLWSPHDVMDLIVSTGEPLTWIPVDFCTMGQVCPTSTVRASLCSAVYEACANSLYCNQTMISCTPRAAGVDARPAVLDFTNPPPSATIDLGSTWVEHDIGAPCNVKVMSESSSMPEEPCPLDQYINQNGSPFTHSFPGTSGCPTCPMFRTSNSLLMGISTDTASATLSNPTLTIYFKNVVEPKNFVIDMQGLAITAGATIEVKELPFDVDEVEKGTIQFKVNDDHATSDELIIEP
jgi:hypothetical protein